MNKKPATIFVAIASYCDDLLPQTLDSCLGNARFPENLRFGICWQYDRQNPVNIDRFKSDRRFRFSEFPIEESQGGCWARSLTQDLWQGETYTLQIDSHMLFAPNWDANLLRMANSYPSPKPIITMIAPLFEQSEQDKIKRHRHFGLRSTRCSEWSKPSGWAPWFDWGVTADDGVVRNRFLSGQFIFAPGIWNEEVKQDPDHYYWGEEFALTLRSYTYGYDFFLPDEMVIWHMYHAQEPPRRHWEHGSEVVRAKSAVAANRLQALAYPDEVNQPLDLGRYGLGDVRTISEYEVFSGMNLKEKTAHPDVFVGRPPDPVTIKSDEAWSDCISFKQFSQAATSQQHTISPR